MATARKRTATKRTTKKAAAARKTAARKAPGSTGEGQYYHIELRSKSGFKSFRTQDVGRKGHIQRVAGRRASGSWDTVKWLISKKDAHLQGGRLVPDTKDAKKLIAELGSRPIRTQGDRFKARPTPNVPERAKPTPAQKRAQSTNIKKAQAARRRAR